MSPDLNGATTQSSLMQVQILVAAGTQTYAGIDLQEFVGNVKLIASATQRSGARTCAFHILESADNSTFATYAGSPTFAECTAAAGTTTIQSAALDTRATKRYIQGQVMVTGATGTFDCQVCAVGEKQQT